MVVLDEIVMTTSYSLLVLEMSVSEYSELLSSEPSKKVCIHKNYGSILSLLLFLLLLLLLLLLFLQDYQQELFQLRDEFESYKKKAQTVLRSKSNPVSDHLLFTLCPSLSPLLPWSVLVSLYSLSKLTVVKIQKSYSIDWRGCIDKLRNCRACWMIREKRRHYRHSNLERS